MIVAGYRLAALTCPGDGGSGVRRVGVVLGLEGHHGGRVELAAGRNRLSQLLKVPLEAGGGVPGVVGEGGEGFAGPPVGGPAAG